MAVISQYSVVSDGQVITASLWNAMELNIINNGLTPSGIEDASANDADMQATTDPYPGLTTSRSTDLLGEIKRLRYLITQITGRAYWYQDPDLNLSNLNTHTHAGTTGQGPQIGTAGIADDAVTNAKIGANAVGSTEIADNAVTAAKIATAVAGNGLAGGGGTALSVNVDGSTLEISSDSLRVKDSGISAAKVATGAISNDKLGDDISAAKIVAGTLAAARGGTGVTGKLISFVSYTGTGVNGRTVAHGLGASPSMVLIQQVDITNSGMIVRYSNHPGSTANTAGGGTVSANTIPSMDSTNVTVGDSANNSGKLYAMLTFQTQ